MGWLADQNQTLYIRRAERRNSHGQAAAIADRAQRPATADLVSRRHNWGRARPSAVSLDFARSRRAASAGSGGPPRRDRLRRGEEHFRLAQARNRQGQCAANPRASRADAGHRPPARPASAFVRPQGDRPFSAQRHRCRARRFKPGATYSIGRLNDAPARKFPHQVVRLPDERLRRRAHGGIAWRQWPDPRRGRRGRRFGRPQHLPHSRESRRKGLFGRRPVETRGRHAADDRARRLRCPGRGRRGAQALADDRHRRRPAGLSPPARPGRRGGSRAPRGRHRYAGHLQIRHAAAAPPRIPQRLPHRAGRLRQILHLLRRALHSRRRSLAAVGRHHRRGACFGRRRRARNRPARPERQRVER